MWPYFNVPMEGDIRQVWLYLNYNIILKFWYVYLKNQFHPQFIKLQYKCFVGGNIYHQKTFRKIKLLWKVSVKEHGTVVRYVDRGLYRKHLNCNILWVSIMLVIFFICFIKESWIEQLNILWLFTLIFKIISEAVILWICRKKQMIENNLYSEEHFCGLKVFYWRFGYLKAFQKWRSLNDVFNYVCWYTIIYDSSVHNKLTNTQDHARYTK
jgi:hypothetical protein